MPEPLPVSIKPSCGRVYRAYLPSTNSGCSTTLRCWLLHCRSGSRCQVFRSCVRAMPHAATAALKSSGCASSWRSTQKRPYIHPSSCCVSRMSYIFVAGTSASGMVIGRSQKRKLSIPFADSATAKKDLRSLPSTRTTKRYLPSR